MNIKDLGKEDFTMYTLCADSMTRDYLQFFWFVAIFSSFILAESILIKVSLGTILGLTICIGLLIFNMVQYSVKFNNLKRIYGIDRGFSLLK